MELVTSTLAAILSIGLLIILHEAGHYWVARRAGMGVRRFSIGFGPAIAKVQRGPTEFQVGAIPLGGYVQIDGLNPHDGTDPKAETSYLAKPFHQRFATIFAGPIANYFIGIALLFVFYAFFFGEPLAPVRVVRVLPESPAARAGLVAGDLIVGTASTSFTLASELRAAIKEGGEKGLVLRVGREGEGATRIVRLVPEANTGGGFRIGVEFEGTDRRAAPKGVAEGLKVAAEHFGSSSVSLLFAVASLIHPRTRDQVEVTGPIGMVKGLSRRVRSSWADGMAYVADISIMLGTANLLPIPGLDGSRLLFLLLGLVRRRPISPQLEAGVHAVGVLLMLGLMVLISIGDVLR